MAPKLSKRPSAAAGPPQKRRKGGPDEVLTAKTVAAAVHEEVLNVEVIDVHTHLLPPNHGKLMLWGIDELLTYHYLVSEYFMVAPSEVTHESFFAMGKRDQASYVWKGLFVDRSPISEACQGVLTTLRRLGLAALAEKRDLDGVRAWFAAQDPAEHCERIFRLAKVRYAVMTNIPYEPAEAEHWLPPKTVTPRLRTALRVDAFLKGDWAAVSGFLRASGMEETLEGARQYLRQWAATYKSEYMMASTPHDWRYPQAGALPPDVPMGGRKLLVEAFSGPGPQLLDDVVMPVCEELSLPIALKLGALRGMSPELNPCCGGDGVAASDLDSLQRLCARFPRVRFLATVLSRADQHQMAVVAQKTRNLHLYGCWWYCNNPSIIEELTRMRCELLGTAFTVQHSDCRVLEQLLYKWDHSRRVIAEALVPYFQRLAGNGWRLTRAEVQRDIRQLFGGSYEEFMARRL